MRRTSVAILLWLIALFAPCSSHGITTVILLRHAEKATQPPDDPPLTAAGRARANVLADALADSGVSAIFVTQFRRTAETAAPLAGRLHIQPQVIPAANSQELVESVRGIQNGTVVVVGHSNTIPTTIAGLGGPSAVVIAESEFDNLFVLTLGPPATSFLRLHYGLNSGGKQLSLRQDRGRVMQMEFSRSGGFAGMATSISGIVTFQQDAGEVSSSNGYHRVLTAAEADSLRKTLAQPGFRSSSTNKNLRDAYQYNIVLKLENKKSRSFVLEEGVPEANANSLLSWIVQECQRIWDHRTRSSD
ncbi:MAG TPA: phosphoglycerate mutase family protein [Candidatus Acidoferrum sp.]|nr:phosphoglycerate mutase family protein [Candidatus Acidoferrum sp.]